MPARRLLVYSDHDVWQSVTDTVIVPLFLLLPCKPAAMLFLHSLHLIKSGLRRDVQY